VPRYRLVVAYLGTGFAGWQRQPGRRTVQGELERALGRIAGAPVRVVGAGRTDAGVHAAGQVAHVDLPAAIPPGGLLRALAALLPDDLRVRRAAVARPDFHARCDAVGKVYVYRMRWRRPGLPWVGLRWAVVRPPAAWDALLAAAGHLEGRFDAASFTVPDHGRAATVRTVRRVEVRRLPWGARIEVEGDGFLRYQVRRMVGALLEVGWGRRPPEWLADLVAHPQPGARIATAPARGLTLEAVRYARAAVVDSDAQG